MKILNFGSINIDKVYRLPHFVRPGETISSTGFSVFSGGKGFNQSTAIARAGGYIAHAGAVGSDGEWLIDTLAADGADVHLIRRCDSCATGHALIQVDDSGQNCIIIEGGANRAISSGDVRAAFSACSRGDMLLIQNEISMLPEIMETAKAKGMEIAFNPAPMNQAVLSYPLDLVSLFIVNEVEAVELSGVSADEPTLILDAMREKFPKADILLTLGSRGAVARFGSEDIFVPARKVTAVDTTAAGDTFIGFFFAERQRGASVKAAMEIATSAAALCVSRMGAAPSIPNRAEV